MVVHRKLIWALIWSSLVYLNNVVYCTETGTDQSSSSPKSQPQSGPILSNLYPAGSGSSFDVNPSVNAQTSTESGPILTGLYPTGSASSFVIDNPVQSQPSQGADSTQTDDGVILTGMYPEASSFTIVDSGNKTQAANEVLNEDANQVLSQVAVVDTVAMSANHVVDSAVFEDQEEDVDQFVVEEPDEEEEEEEEEEEVEDLVEPEAPEEVAPEPPLDAPHLVESVDPNAELVATLNDVKAENDLLNQIADLMKTNAQLKAELAAITAAPAVPVAHAARPAAPRHAAALTGVARGAVARRGLPRGGAMAARAPECGIGHIVSSGKVMATVAHDATAYVVDGKQHTLAFNQGTSRSNNSFDVGSRRQEDLIMAGPRPRVTIPAAEAAHSGEKTHAHDKAHAARGGAAQAKRRRDPNEVGIVNIESSDKVMATVVSESTAYVVDGEKHTLALNQDTALSDNRFAKPVPPVHVAAPAKAEAKAARQPASSGAATS